MIRRLPVFLLALLVLSEAFGQSVAQAPPPASTAADPAMPSDPKALMLLVAQVNGLQGVAMPWHLEATYQVFDKLSSTTVQTGYGVRRFGCRVESNRTSTLQPWLFDLVAF
jgi:hypothetical protein